jgi:hypothetical protein
MSSRHTNEDNAPHDAGDEALDTLLTGADEDLQDALDAALNVDAGFAAIVGTTPRPATPSLPGAHTPTPGAAGPGFGAGPVLPFGPSGRTGAGGIGGGYVGAGAGMGGMGQGREDEEHERPSYLVEPDPDDVFSTDEMTAPPVIGDWVDGKEDNDSSEG